MGQHILAPGLRQRPAYQQILFRNWHFLVVNKLTSPSFGRCCLNELSQPKFEEFSNSDRNMTTVRDVS